MIIGRKVLEWDNAGPEDIVYRFPDNRLNWGSTIIVRENQWGMFFKDGKALDLFQAGRHKIKTMDLPFLGDIIKLFAGDVFEASCIFTSRAQFDGKFGGRTQTQELAPLLFNGQYWFKVEDPKLFIMEVCANNNIFTTTAINNYIRGYFNENLMQELSQFTLRQVYGKLSETSLKVKVGISRAFNKIGLELIDVKFLKIDTEEKYRDRLFFMQTGGVGAAGVMASETQKAIAHELGKSTGGGNANFMINPGMNGAMNTNNIQAGNAGNFISCAHCGSKVAANTKFCSNCGKNPQKQEVQPSKDFKFCKNCGQKLSTDQKFCDKCGKPTETLIFCPKCGNQIKEGKKFCGKCGSKL